MRRQTLLCLLLILPARAGDHYQEVATFTSGKATLSVRIEFRADGDRRGLLRMDDDHSGGILFLDKAQWTALQGRMNTAMTRSLQLKAGQTMDLGLLETRGGPWLDIQAFQGARMPAVRLIRVEGPGSSGPKVRFELSAGSYDRMRSALTQVAKQL